MNHGWQAQFSHEFMQGTHRLYLWRDLGSEVEVVSAELVGTRTDPALVSQPGGLLLPRGAYEAIVAAIDPPAHQAEVRRLEEALTLERARVDRALAHLGQ